MFCKSHVRCKSIITLALSQDNHKIVVRYCVNRAPVRLPCCMQELSPGETLSSSPRFRPCSQQRHATSAAKESVKHASRSSPRFDAFSLHSPFSCDMLQEVRMQTHNKLGDRSLSAAGLRLWNDLSPGLRRSGLTFNSFRQSLKSHLFGDRSA